MKKIKMTYNLQSGISFALAILGMLAGTATGEQLFSRSGWVLAGLIFVVHPMYPDSPYWTNLPKEKAQLYMRVVGLFIIVFGLMTRFGS